MRKRKKKKKRRIFLGILIFLLWVIAAGLVVALVLFSDDIKEMRQTAAKLALASTLSEYEKGSDTTITDADGNEIFSVNSDTRVQVSVDYDEISEYVINAFVAVEDQTFWTNDGYDAKGIIRVIWRYIVTKGDEAHGASTITQQLAKSLYLTSETTLTRKITELFLARYLTRIYSKEDIITAYCNSVYYANNFYGIEAAAQGYFGKNASELTLAESAFLCAIPNSPTYYDPWDNPENTATRQAKILSDMLECGYITQEEYEEALAEEIVLQSEEDYKASKTTTRTYAETTMASYALHCAIQWKMEEDGFEFEYSWESDDDYEEYETAYNEAYELAREEIYAGGYTIYTSLDPEAQEILQDAVDEALSSDTEVDEDDGRYTLQSAATCIDNETGKVIAVVGGRTQDGVTDEYNRAYQAYRQPGSSIKPLIIYTPAFMSEDEDGNLWSANSYLKNIDVDDANAATSQEELESLTGSYVRLSSAVEKSTNGAALYLYARVGVYTGLSYITQMQFDKIVPGDYTIASGLGGLTYGVTTEQMAGAYYTLYNDGYYVETTCLIEILDADGDSVYEDSESVQVYDTYAAQEMTSVLQGVITSGTAKSMGWNTSWIEAAGKTGTTNDYYDAWFCGYTPYYTIAVWIGEDTPATSEYCKSSTYTCAIWKTAMEALCRNKDSADFDLSEYEQQETSQYTTAAAAETDPSSEETAPEENSGEETAEETTAGEETTHEETSAAQSETSQETPETQEAPQTHSGPEETGAD